jgi:uncharacterized protein YneF (UPF0154 family)
MIVFAIIVIALFAAMIAYGTFLSEEQDRKKLRRNAK